MDYSLYLVIEKLDPDDPAVEQAETRRNTFISQYENEAYHIGIIDYLQTWDTQKKQEQFLKRVFMQRDVNQLSAVEPKFYCQRFVDFMRGKVF